MCCQAISLVRSRCEKLTVWRTLTSDDKELATGGRTAENCAVTAMDEDERAGAGSGSGVSTTARWNFAGTRRPSEVAARHWSTARSDVIVHQSRSPIRPSVASPHRRDNYLPWQFGQHVIISYHRHPPSTNSFGTEKPCVFVNACRRHGARDRRRLLCRAVNSLRIILFLHRFTTRRFYDILLLLLKYVYLVGTYVIIHVHNNIII